MTTAASPFLFRELQPGNAADALAFRQLNEEWITQHFVLEPKDVEALADPEHGILAAGGRVYLGVLEGEIVACCALLPIASHEYEVAKMAVTASAQGRGLGREVLAQTIAAARALGATRLYLETNRRLGPAIHLYTALGFRDLPPERVTPSPYARANVYMELHLTSSQPAT